MSHTYSYSTPLKKFFSLLVLSSYLILHVPALAQSLPSDSHIQARLIAEPTGIIPGKSFWVGLHLKLEPTWHVYWKNPGDAGLPVSMTWSLPDGFSAEAIQWPYPEKISVPPLMNFGYSGEVLLPVQIQTPEKISGEGKVEFKAKAKWIICQDICLPGSAELTLSLPLLENTTSVTSDEAPADLKNAALFRSTRFNLPTTSLSWKFSAQIFDSTLILIAKHPSTSMPALVPFSFFPEAQNLLDYNAPQKFYPIAQGFVLELPRVPANPESPEATLGPDSLMGVAVSETHWGITGGPPALEIRVLLERGKAPPKALATPVLITNESPAPTPKAGHGSQDLMGGVYQEPEHQEPSTSLVQLLLMLGGAFVGGLILNLMPCVLPVLSLKIFDFVKRAGQSRWKIFSHGLTFSAGVLVSFWLLAGILLILRSGGQHLGWGFQLQSPTFIMVLCALFFLFSLNLFGVFELGSLFTRIGTTKEQSGHAGSFFAGVTATVVATPCTAPFMGSAMGYAFSQPAYFAMLVFTSVGLGMAAPYLVLSGFPGLIRFLPKPGVWMEHLKQFMGFPLLATAIWLAWVLGHQAGVDALIALLSVLLLAGISAWILGKWTVLHRSQSVRIVAGLVAFFVFVPAFILVLVYLDSISGTGTKSKAAMPGTSSIGHENGQITLANPDEIQWENFSENRLAEFISEGKPVFVDFTADWCLSCKVNERIALSSKEVVEKFRQSGLALLKADWTLRDEAISRALSKYGRNSIPLYVIYGGHGPEDYTLLPEVLTPGIVLEALEKLAKRGEKEVGKKHIGGKDIGEKEPGTI